MTERVPNSLVGIAGVHYVAAELSRRGLVALPTVRNAAGYDIIVVTPDGRRHANIQVKTSLKRVSFWPMPRSEKVCSGPRDHYVLVRWDGKRFEGFMLSGKEAKRVVEVMEDDHRERIKRRVRTMIFRHVPINGRFARNSSRWRRQWENWTLASH